MAEDLKAKVYFWGLVLKVIFPLKYAWEFMRLFGEEFTYAGRDGQHIRPVNEYGSRDNHMNITVIIGADQEEKFHKFVKKFCEDRKIPLQDRYDLVDP